MSPPWMPLYVADYLRDTRRLHAREHGAYLLLIMEYWTAGSLPSDDAELARLAALSDREWREVRPKLLSFFGPGWTHARIDRELAAAQDKYEKRAAAGKAGGRAKAKGKHEASNASRELEANELAEPKPGSTNHNHSTSYSSEASASGGEPPQPPTLDELDQWPADPIERVWTEGIHLLRGMAVGEREARSNVGRWMKATGNRAEDVLAAIRRARDMGTKDPIPLVGRILNPVNRPPSGGSNDATSVHAAAERLAERVENGLRSGDRGSRGREDVRLLAQGGRG